jgi:serine/threonine protein kinase
MDTLSYEYSVGTQGGSVLQGTYRLGRRIGRGGMGEVYEATHARLPGRFAVKILLPELADNREALARFCREAEIMSELRHPHIVQVFDFNTTVDGMPYFVMEFLEGVDLETRLNQTGRLPLPEVVRIVEAVASALGSAHGRGIVHRDLKPSNMFLVRVDGQDEEFVKVLDFGISKMRAATTRLSKGWEVFGTPQYMAPEQARGQTELIDGRADQFALAAITHKMLTGHDPFVGDDPASLLYQVVHAQHPPLARHMAGDSSRLQPVLDRALAKDLTMRFDDIVEFARALALAAEATPELPASGAPPSRPAVPSPLTTHGRPTLSVSPRSEPVMAVEPRAGTRRTPAGQASGRPPLALITNDDDAAADASLAPLHDWELPSGVDRVPRKPYRAIAFAALALALLGVLVSKNRYREIRADVAFVRQNLGAMLHRPVLMPQPSSSAPGPLPVPGAAAVPAPAPAASTAPAVPPAATPAPVLPSPEQGDLGGGAAAAPAPSAAAQNTR